MLLASLVDSVLWTRARPFVTFRIDPDRVIRSGRPAEAKSFVPDETYIELRLSQLWLQNRRDFWISYIPMASFMTEFLVAGKSQIVPFVLGPQSLSKATAVQKGDDVENRNIDVAGPFPYESGDVKVFAGLFRVVEKDWAKGALGLLETVAKAFDATRLTSMISIADPLVSGVESLLGMTEVQMRVGLQRSYNQPGKDSPGNQEESVDVLSSGYQALLGREGAQVTPQQRRRFWVIDGRLQYGDSSETASDYRDTDFMLIRLTPLTARPDYKQFDFDGQFARAREEITQGNAATAAKTFMRGASSLATSRDIVKPQRSELIADYRDKHKLALQEYKQNVKASRGQGFSGGVRLKPTTEAELRRVALRARAAGSVDPEQLLASIQLD